MVILLSTKPTGSSRISTETLTGKFMTGISKIQAVSNKFRLNSHIYCVRELIQVRISEEVEFLLWIWCVRSATAEPSTTFINYVLINKYVIVNIMQRSYIFNALLVTKVKLPKRMWCRIV
jgi:hypothetical protein